MHRLMRTMLPGLLLVGVLGGCSTSPTSTSMGTANLKLTDAPGDFQAVNLVVRQVAVKAAGRGDDEHDWEIMSSQTQTFDLLQLRNGVFATLGLSPLPAGRYEQLRLKLGSGSNVVVDGAVHPLRVASGDQSGLKLVGTFVVPHNGQVDLALDFDVARSLHRNGDGSYTLRPRIRVVTVSIPDRTPGTIRGAVMPADAQASVYVLANLDTVASTMADDQGNFQVGLLSAGTYALGVHSTHGYSDQTVSNVAVLWGQTTNVGTVQLAPAPPPPPPPPPVNGTISGLLSPVLAAGVSVRQGSTVVETLDVDIEGRFLATDLPPGTYDVVIYPVLGYQNATRTGVVVVAGANTDLGVITLTPIGPPPPPTPGSITGQIYPPGFATTLSVVQNGATVASMDAAADGSFAFTNLPPGTYTVHVHPAVDYPDFDIPGVVVTSGQATNLGQVNI